MVQPAASVRQHDARITQSDGMLIEYDVPITMSDGTILRANVFRPIDEGQYPVLMSYGPTART